MVYGPDYLVITFADGVVGSQIQGKEQGKPCPYNSNMSEAQRAGTPGIHRRAEPRRKCTCVHRYCPVSKMKGTQVTLAAQCWAKDHGSYWKQCAIRSTHNKLENSRNAPTIQKQHLQNLMFSISNKIEVTALELNEFVILPERVGSVESR